MSEFLLQITVDAPNEEAATRALHTAAFAIGSYEDVELGLMQTGDVSPTFLAVRAAIAIEAIIATAWDAAMAREEYSDGSGKWAKYAWHFLDRDWKGRPDPRYYLEEGEG